MLGEIAVGFALAKRRENNRKNLRWTPLWNLFVRQVKKLMLANGVDPQWFDPQEWDRNLTYAEGMETARKIYSRGGNTSGR